MIPATQGCDLVQFTKALYPFETAFLSDLKIAGPYRFAAAIIAWAATLITMGISGSAAGATPPDLAALDAVESFFCADSARIHR